VANTFLTLFMYQKQVARLEESVVARLLDCGKVGRPH
jgi:hypothetical protein